MLATIGVMIGIYIITRMISFLTRKEPRSESTIVKVFAWITIVVTTVAIIDFLARGTTSTP
ncbi:MAG: hypothetical protein A2W23_07645 [Planctomycetes bacterium RBG_16_43_13]|nr:MAG: hypothetical protein A2W23_07645 [Planctomycetes bacterium RBG_16_43_13]